MLPRVACALLRWLLKVPEPTESDDSVLDYCRYATLPERYPTWPERILAPLGLSSTLVRASFLGPLVFAVGLAFATGFGFAGTYLSSWAVYLGAADISLTWVALRRQSHEVHRVYARLRPVFLESDEVYLAALKDGFGRFTDTARSVVASLVVFASATTLVVLAYFASDYFDQRGLRALRPGSCQPGWFDNPIGPRMALLLGYAVVISVLLGTALHILWINVGFLRRLGQFQVVPLPNVLRMRLRPVTDFYVQIAGAWFVGVGFVGALFYDAIDIPRSPF